MGKTKEAEFKLKSKTSDGVDFEAVMDKIGNAELNLNFKDSDMKVCNKLDHKGVFTVDTTMFKVADNLDAVLKFKTPECNSTSKDYQIAAHFLACNSRNHSSSQRADRFLLAADIFRPGRHNQFLLL